MSENNENRSFLAISVKKKTLERIKKKYGNLGMTDATAEAIHELEIRGACLLAAIVTVGLVTVFYITTYDSALETTETLMAIFIANLFRSKKAIKEQIHYLTIHGIPDENEADKVNRLTESITNIMDGNNNEFGKKMGS